ncbi:MAG: replicative DNA helicase [Candidatus Zambryskibacteria bacterium RIFCSPLOWO2_02_FULL_51_21]|uniref:Replicative DNA helicase n=1 Tax=Candidatus Zambryskibacteria bacterium RIFCSPHIGHO2_02_FULL_43_37 TaxID=1802749 RepID=A0A1G2TIZ0_9BACT|nr:MAG: replicative DNA helicase [Candidatus Zambryskibacteria bacterium RIFCSPHIGHO2_01_FULL_52_18]OHA96581.1 MAG: replicative DNA helicase [Candidatus Zambryskibacteria bacterium RIFCSPHIGHO2_02_FULL_43_37]OHB07630.1 MAG: replicative DNA helicase [Candidatus Zambryskibacteria bacterium RIFCSPLOWO2_01_FULL_52_12]OHB11155.1 MAG: replicative DNA helicase [Candidatus Zambryskibacteria bacterium RIFCSPLOWO2_02_FULL_51_21]
MQISGQSPLTNAGLRIPPHSAEAEMALLGSIMLRPDAIYEILDIVVPASFYFEKHRTIFEAMLELFGKHSPIDILSLSSRLKEKGELERLGGTSYLTELAGTVPSSANVKHYAEIVMKKHMMRQLIEASEHLSHLGFNEAGELEEILDQAEKKIFDITQHFAGSARFRDLTPLLAEAFERFEKLSSAEHELRGVPTGFKALDDILGGFQKSDLIILAARPSVGKTALALDIARRTASEHQTPVGIFSLEMSADQLVDRIVAAQSKTDASIIRKGIRTQTGTWREDVFKNIRDALDDLSRTPIYIDDQPGNTIMKMRSAARKLKIEKGLKLLIVDYLQLMAPSSARTNDSMVQQVTEISRSLKHLARELDIPVIALSQLSRAIETRGGKPKLSDLRDSGSLEQDADCVIFIHSNEEDLRDENGRMKEVQRRELIIAKHRNGPLGTAVLDFHSRFNTFVEIDYSNYGKAEEDFKNF